jgi:hypothetical protein
MIDVRKLAALDMALHGRRLIVAELALGAIGGVVGGVWTIGQGIERGDISYSHVAFGIWLVGIGLNYVPLLLHALTLLRPGAVEEEGRPELPYVRRYNVQQMIVFVPLLVVAAAAVQEVARRRSGRRISE